VKVGDLVKWSWHLRGDSWDASHFIGVVLGSRLAKTDMEKIILYRVLVSDGLINEIREDIPTLEVVSESR
jgi:hypothetical protein